MWFHISGRCIYKEYLLINGIMYQLNNTEQREALSSQFM